jgi:hypothetical protein
MVVACGSVSAVDAANPIPASWPSIGRLAFSAFYPVISAGIFPPSIWLAACPA